MNQLEYSFSNNKKNGYWIIITECSNDGICNQDVYIVSINHPNYELIYNKNSEEIKKNCRCLTPDLGQYIEKN